MPLTAVHRGTAAQMGSEAVVDLVLCSRSAHGGMALDEELAMTGTAVEPGQPKDHGVEARHGSGGGRHRFPWGARSRRVPAATEALR